MTCEGVTIDGPDVGRIIVSPGPSSYHKRIMLSKGDIQEFTYWHSLIRMGLLTVAVWSLSVEPKGEDIPLWIAAWLNKSGQELQELAGKMQAAALKRIDQLEGSPQRHADTEDKV